MGQTLPKSHRTRLNAIGQKLCPICVYLIGLKKDADSLDITVNAIKQVQHCPKCLWFNINSNKWHSNNPTYKSWYENISKSLGLKHIMARYCVMTVVFLVFFLCLVSLTLWMSLTQALQLFRPAEVGFLPRIHCFHCILLSQIYRKEEGSWLLAALTMPKALCVCMYVWVYHHNIWDDAVTSQGNIAATLTTLNNMKWNKSNLICNNKTIYNKNLETFENVVYHIHLKLKHY